jgi:membrane fusion protein, multidrug efflux system
MKRGSRILLVLAGVIALAVVYRGCLYRPSVKTIVVSRGDLLTVVYATGSVTADSMATLRSKPGGVVDYVAVREGMKVDAGELLVRTDQRDKILRVRNAEHDAQSARIERDMQQRNFSRQEKLYEARSIAEDAFDAAREQRDLAELTVSQKDVALEIARRDLTDTEIRAPFAGTIAGSKVNLGDMLTPNAECFLLVSPGSILVQADIAEQDVARIALNMRSIVAFDAFPDRRFDGTVCRLVPKTDEATKTSRALIRLTDAPANLTVGMTATVNVLAAETKNALLIPRTALIQKDSSSVVFIVKDGRLHRAVLSIGAADNRFAEVRSGLNDGTRIVAAPKAGYRDGQKVKAD